MEEKMQSGIHSIQLEGRTYHNTPPLNPTLINFFYGKNGAGKSTIGNILEKKLLLIAVPNEYKKVEVDEEGLVGQAEKILGADFVTNSQQILKKIKID